eukprot:g20860.t1
MATTVVKVQCDDGEIYRLTLQEEPSFETIVQLVASCCPEAQAFLSHSNCALKYADDEGDLCTLAPATFEDFLCMQRAQNSRLLKLRLKMPCSGRAPEKEDMPRRAPELDRTGHSGDHLASSQDYHVPATRGTRLVELDSDRKTLSDAELPSKSDTPPQGPPPGLEKEDQDRDFSSGPGAWGPGGNGGGPRRLLSTLRMLREAGMLTPAMFASLTVQWLPLLTQRVARKVDKINHMARDGLDATLQKMLEIALGGRGGQRRLGEAILEMLKALRGLGFEVQTHFCETNGLATAVHLRAACPGNIILGALARGVGLHPLWAHASSVLPALHMTYVGTATHRRTSFTGLVLAAGKIFSGKDGKFRSKGNDKAEKGEYHFDWKGAGKGAGGWMEAAMGLALAHQFSGGMLGFNHHLHNGHEKEEVKAEKLGAVDGDAEQLELDRKVADLLELQLANEEVIRDLLISNHGDIAQVTKILTS